MGRWWPGHGLSSDTDVIYGGQGHDDLLGGQGTNHLYAWSQNPQPIDDTQFGVYVDANGLLFDNDAGGLYKLEDTGLNRVLGGPRTDYLYGGSGLDFLYGNGAPDGAPDQLYDRNGKTFDTRGIAAGDEWKAYAQSTDKVWYYGGTNRDDVINVDYVTEPGVLQGHHLITRLTNNNGNYTFDAQVRLDFDAVDNDGNLIWSRDDTYYGLAVTGSDVVPGTGVIVGARSNGQLTGDAEFTLSVDGGVLTTITIPQASTAANQSIRDLVQVVNEALSVAGLSGKVSARAAGDKLSLVHLGAAQSPNASLTLGWVNDVARDQLHFTDGQTATSGFVGSNGLSSLLPSEGNFLAIIIDALDGNDQITVGPTVTKSVWTDAGRGNDRVEYVSGKPILIDTTDVRAANEVGNGDRLHAYDLGGRLVKENKSGDGKLDRNTLFTGLTIDSPTDIDWYRFQLKNAPTSETPFVSRAFLRSIV